MSETVDTGDAKLKAALAKLQELIPPGFQMERKDDGPGREDYLVSWSEGGQPRSALIAILGLGEQFDLAEVTGAISADNQSWQSMAYIAGSVRTLDTTPVPTPSKKEHLRETLTKLGLLGFNAASLVVNGYRGGNSPAEVAAVLGEADTKAIVKN